MDFLSGHHARLQINDLIGQRISSEYGTSVGTILGAIIFISCVHDTPIQPKFADDLVSHMSGEDTQFSRSQTLTKP